MTTLTRPSNPKIKLARALRQRKARDESGLFLVEGIRPVGEAVEAGAALEFLCYAPESLSSEYAQTLIVQTASRGIPCLALADEVFATLAEKEHPQGILAVAQQPRAQLAALTRETFPWGVALVAAQDPGNIGSILRTVDAVGANGLLLLEPSADPYHPTAVRASMGTLFWLPVVSASFNEFALWAKNGGYHVYGTSAHGKVATEEIAAYTPPMVLLLGSERAGLSPEQAAVCDVMLRLPMRGRATSLNLAVAAGVMLYAMLQRQTR